MIGNVRTFATILIVLMSISVSGSESSDELTPEQTQFVSAVQELHREACKAMKALDVPGAKLPDEIKTVAQAIAYLKNPRNKAGIRAVSSLEHSDKCQTSLDSISRLLDEIEALQKRALDRMPQ